MDFLVFQLLAPLSSWGEPAIGEFRGSAPHPSHSAIIGLLGAALGVQRDDDDAHAALRDDFGLAVALLDEGALMRDYHTAQVPPKSTLRGRPKATRRDELAVPRTALSTVLSTRDYRCGAASLVALMSKSVAASGRLNATAAALRRPCYPLYLGRKSCPPASPLWPQVLQADDAITAFRAYRDMFDEANRTAGGVLESLPPIRYLYVDEYVPAGVEISLSATRHDRLVRRSAWQFGNRVEGMAILNAEG